MTIRSNMIGEHGGGGVDSPHDHSHDDDLGIPFWRRAAITEGQLYALKREINWLKSQLDQAVLMMVTPELVSCRAELAMAQADQLAARTEAAECRTILTELVAYIDSGDWRSNSLDRIMRNARAVVRASEAKSVD